MSEFLERISKLSPQRLALLADELNERVQAAERDRRVPLAVVGMGCRLPGGVHGAEEFWTLLKDGTDAVSEVPLSRWNTQAFYDPNPATPGKMATRWGGFIEEHAEFDPKFFGIAPTEAMSMDPQQRLLLETVWESLEHAGIAPTSLTGTKTGVFIGICNGDYSQVALSSPREKISPYFAPGLSHAVAAGRISYVLGLQGPSLAVDTSCSASLVAVHLACQSLRLGECDAALAGGVNLILNPDITIALSQSRMMAPDGRCKAFSDSADGFVRGEGCGMIVLKRLPDAIRDRNRILAVIRGSACNQDGRSSGLTAPNGPSQEAVIAAALTDAGIEPNEVDYLEAHGTGTALGDPIEAGALNAVFAGRAKTADPLFVGSVKTNLGHLESAAGIAGLMKLVLSIQHGKIPPSLHFETPNHRIEWNRLPIQIPTVLQAWKRRGRKRVGGVSSFGFSGTNAHVIVEEYLHEAVPPVTSTGQTRETAAETYLFPLSAKTNSALKQVAAQLRDYLVAHPSLPLDSIARTLLEGRSHFEYRAGLVASSAAEFVDQMSRVASDGSSAMDPSGCIVSGRMQAHSPRVAFFYGGEDSALQLGGQQLEKHSPVFREALQRCEQIIRNDLGRTLIQGILSDASMDATANLAAWHKRVSIFSLQYALAELWRSYGIEPVAIFGYGPGEVAAACMGGVFNLRDGLRLAIASVAENPAELQECVDSIQFRSPQIPLISNRTGYLTHNLRINSADHWREISGSTAPSRDTLASLAKENFAACVLLGGEAEVNKLARLTEESTPCKYLASLEPGNDGASRLLRTVAALYVLGCELNAKGILWNATADTISLPTYPFERERYWLDSGTNGESRACADWGGFNQDGLVGGSLEMPSSSGRDIEAENRDAWIYDLVWESKPLAHQTSAKLDEELIAAMTGTRATGDLLRVEQATAATQPLYTSYILRALQEAGLSPLPTSDFSAEELSQRLKIVPARRRVLGRLLGILTEDGILERTQDRFRFIDFQSRPDADSELEKFRAEYPECRTEIKILHRCAKKLSAVLRGEYDPMQLVFTDGSVDEAEQIYERSPVCQFFNERAATLIRAATDSIQGRSAQILEIGGGTGATTISVLHALRDRAFKYCFTDVSPVFLSRARVKFADTPGMDYRLLDIENDPVQQGFDAGKYDLILAANVLHATADLRQTLAHVRTLLAPGGILLLVEGTRPDRWLDLTFGLTNGWWRFSDLELRPDHPLISVEEWARLLSEVGMGSCKTVAYTKDHDVPSQQTIVMAQVDERARAVNRNGATATRHWNILADEFGVGHALHRLLTEQGESSELIHRPKAAAEIAAQFRRLQATDATNVSQEIVYLWGMDGDNALVSPNSPAAGEGLCGKTLVHLIQALTNLADNKAHLWIATRGAQAAGDVSPEIGGVLQSLAWGVGRTLGLEVPGLYRGLIDLDPTMNPETAATHLMVELLSADGEDQVAHRGGQRLVPRLENSRLTDRKEETGNRIHNDGSYLIVGGLGGVGLTIAKWVAQHNPGHLVLFSRTGAGDDAGAFAAERQSAIKEIEALGVKVTVMAGDVASAEDTANLFRRFGQELPPLRGVFHAATVVHEAELSNLTDDAFDRMLRPKVVGTWLLHDHTKTMALDFFLAFSSTTSLLGAKGLAHYAAANQFLDCFAHYRRAMGLPMLSVNWGAWNTMRLVLPKEQERLFEAGLRPMSSQTIFNMFEDLLASPRAQVMVADIDWNILKPLFEAQRARPLLEKLGQRANAKSDNHTASSETAASLTRAMMMTPGQRRASIEAFVLEQAAHVLGYRNGELPAADLPLTDLGLDSLMAVDLKNRLQAWLGQELSPTVVFDHPSVSALVELLETTLWAADGMVASEMAPSGGDEIRI